jgi:hypothetical protein
MWRYPALLALGGLFISGVVMVFGPFFSKRRDRKAMRAALGAARSDREWKETESVKDIVCLYMTMVAKHGPDSEEAKSFRFGTDSKLMKELHSDSDFMQTFEQQADIIDDTYRRIRT